MTDYLQYKLRIGVDEETDVDDVEAIEEDLQQILLDLYDNDSVESIKVTRDGHTPQMGDDDIKELIDIVDGLDSTSLRKAIDCARALSDAGADNDE